MLLFNKLVFFNSAAQDAIFFTNLSRDQKSLVTSVIKKTIFKFIANLFCSNIIA